MKMSNLPRDMAEEVLSRVPLTSMRRVRSTCKKWNNLSKGRSFAKKHLGQASSKVVMMMNFKMYLMSINLDNNVESTCIKPEGKLISLDDSDEVDVSQVFHCEGLLLCIPKDNTRVVVWNPYWGKTRWIEDTHNFHRLDRYIYALGYESNCKSHKILRFVHFTSSNFVEFKIYDLNSGSWRVLVDFFSQDKFKIDFYDRGVTLKGNTYWFAKERRGDQNNFLVCFDFTRERFGPRLPVPFEWFNEDTLSLSSVREEQLAVLFQRWDTYQMEIWVTTKIEPDTVSWSSKVFLAVDMRLTCFPFQFVITAASFFIDEEKKVAFVFDKTKDRQNPIRNTAYVVGVDGSSKQVDLGESAYKHYFPLVCSYVPSLIHP